MQVSSESITKKDRLMDGMATEQTLGTPVPSWMLVRGAHMGAVLPKNPSVLILTDTFSGYPNACEILVGTTIVCPRMYNWKTYLRAKE